MDALQLATVTPGMVMISSRVCARVFLESLAQPSHSYFQFAVVVLLSASKVVHKSGQRHNCTQYVVVPCAAVLA